MGGSRTCVALLCLLGAGCQSTWLARFAPRSSSAVDCPYASRTDGLSARAAVAVDQAQDRQASLDKAVSFTGVARSRRKADGADHSREMVKDAPSLRQHGILLAGGEATEDVTTSPALATAEVDSEMPAEYFPRSLPENVMLMDLPTALALVGGTHPVVGFAQWRVQEAYARLDSANAMWLPSLRAGISFHRHDGNLQASNGNIDDVNRSSLQAGLGAGATGAGTTPIPGIVAEFHVSDAIFLPRIAEKTAWARQHAATAACQDQLLAVALAYLNLLSAEQELQVLAASQARTAELAQLTADYAAAGQGLQADADRLATELILVEGRVLEAQELRDVALARLLETVSLEPGCQVAIADPALVPIELVAMPADSRSLIGTALSQRPELREAQCLVAAACDEFERQRYAPFVPSVLLALSETGFGGGLGNRVDQFSDRMDFDAIAVWEIRNLGLGEHAARRETASRVQQSRYEQLQIMDRVAREVSEACSQVTHRRNASS